MMTKQKAATILLGEKVNQIDYAVPQNWANHVEELTGFNPCGFTVWRYDGDFFGRPYPLTCEGCRILGKYSELVD